MLSGGLSVSSVTSFFRTGNRPQSVIQAPTQQDITRALEPLFDYFNENFALMKQTLTDPAMIMVMTRLWKEVLATIEALLVPPLSDKLSQQRPLTRQEVDIVFKWLRLLFDFFHAADEDGNSDGVPMDVLKSPKYHELQNLNFFYFESTDDLVRTSEGMAAATQIRQQEQAARMNRMSAPAAMGHQFGGAAGLVGMPSRKHKTIMLSRNLGTMRQAKIEKRKEAQADPSDDMILRILRMRPEAERYLRDRSRQKVWVISLMNVSLSCSQSTGTSCSGAGRRNDCATESECWWWTHDRRRHGYWRTATIESPAYTAFDIVDFAQRFLYVESGTQFHGLKGSFLTWFTDFANDTSASLLWISGVLGSGSRRRCLLGFVGNVNGGDKAVFTRG
jgi:hypothetical protein